LQAKSLGTQLLTLAANPIGATILAVVGAITLLYKEFTSTKAGGEQLEQIMSGLGAVLDVLRDRVLKAGSAISKFFSGDFKGALKDARSSVSGIGGEIEKEFKQAASAKRYLQEVDDALRSLSVSRAKLNRDLARSKEIITDENASYAEKKKAIEEVRVAEEKQTQAELRNAEKKLKAIKLANSLSDTNKENLDKQAQAEAELYALQEKSATDRRAIRKTELRADKEEQARLKAIADERNAKAKEANEKAKALAKENITLKQIEEVGGASAGAITALLLAVGYDIDEIKTLLDNLSIEEFLDNKER
jgi:chromosome segregation ATPase